MQKKVIRILTFFITLSIGILISFVWYYSFYSKKEYMTYSIEHTSKLEPIKASKELTDPWVLKIDPCEHENLIKMPSSDWKGKGIVKGGVVNRRATCGKLPEYSQIAKDKNISDIVTVSVLIDEIGEVKEAHALSGHPLLLKSAVEAAHQTRFSPTLLGGVSCKVKGILMYKFDNQKGTWLQDPSAPDNPFKKVTK